MVGCVGVRAFIAHFAIGFERHEAVRKAEGYEQLIAILGAKLGTNPLAIGRRTLPDIDRNIENSSSDAPYQLCLGARWGLKMQATERKGGSRVGMIVLDEGTVDSPRGKGGYGMYLCEPATVVTMTLGADELNGTGCHVAR